MRIETTDPYCDVELQPIQTAGGEARTLPRQAVMVRDDKGLFQMASIMGEEYPLVKTRFAGM